MKVLLYEQWHGGHYANYMDCLVPAIAQLCDTLVIATGEKMGGSTAAKERWAVIPNVEFTPFLPEVAPGLNIRDRYAATRNLLRCLHDVRPDFTIVPSADAQSTGIAVLHQLGYDIQKKYGPVEGTLHYGYGYAASEFRNRVKEFVYSNTYSRLPYASVNFVNFRYYEYVAAKKLIEPARVRFVGDPVPQSSPIGKTAARQLLGLAAEGRYIGLLGSLDNRKAVPQLLSAFRRAQLPASDRMILAGRLDPAYAELIHNDYSDLVRDGRLVVIDRFLTTQELEHGYEALDLATIAYCKSPVLASLALKAVAVGTPVLADNFGWLGAAVQRFDLGAVTDVYDSAKFADAMKTILPRRHCSSHPKAVARLLAFHSTENFVAQMTSGLRRHRGLPPIPMIDWSSVMSELPADRQSLG
jgi:glycosyltransferase involved in cell wall biosynthesis